MAALAVTPKADSHTFAEATRLAGVSYFVAAEWLKQGMVIVDGGGVQGRRRRVGLGGVVALSVIGELRSRGISREAIKPLSVWLSSRDGSELRRAVSKGRTILVAEHGSSEVRLVTAEKVVKLPAGSAVAIDLGPAIQSIEASE